MYIWDTNGFILFRGKDENTLRHVRENAGQIWLSSVAAEELLAGQFNAINRARAPRTSLSLSRAHADFAEVLEDFKTFPMLAFSEEAEAVYRTFPASVIRIGPQDCRIAAQAIAHNLTVVTRNVRDFQAIGAPCADWSL